MPGPFPGMDPYLESPTYWSSLHGLLIAAITGELNRILPDGFAASNEERLYVVERGRDIIPDTVVLHRPPASRALAGAGAAGAAAVADPPLLFDLGSEHVRERYVEILTTRGPERVVTLIEFLSPANKAAGGTGHEVYLRKQSDALESEVHLLEIDLLREGAHTVAMERGPVFAAQPYDYLTCLHRAEPIGNRLFACWPTTVRDRLPRLPIPLTHDIPDVALDLQAVFDRAYDEGPYRRRVDYAREPETPLRPADAAWADSLLRQKGRRP